MNREEMLKKIILGKYKSVREFAMKIEFPPTTVNSILKNVGGTAIDKMIIICNDLNIDVECFSPKLEKIHCLTACTPKEQNIIEKYRVLDDRGKQTVCDTLDREYSYVAKKGNINCEMAKDIG